MTGRKKTRVAVLVSGSGTNLRAIINASEKDEINASVVVVISNCEDAFALKRAVKHDIPNYFVDLKEFESRDKYEEEIVKILKEHKADLVILAGYMLLAGQKLINEFENKIMNIHPALLPSFPGTHSVKDALEYGVKVSGCTVHFVDEGLDTGPIILQKAVSVLDNDTEETLHNRIHEVEYELYPEAIRLFSEGKLRIDGHRVKVMSDEEM
ncbi:MAG: phosphoribosylglycinamide formyltransferase [Actinobacteria bacterium]|nr:phosphoribosylglycinamide formyltransferase [Actinomycetota bacterium]